MSAFPLLKRIDEFSYQVYVDSDPRFWFRLVRERDRDVITDFFVGSFSWELSGSLLAECYRTLGLIPRNTVVFKDILSSSEVTPELAGHAGIRYTSAGTGLLGEFGLEMADARVEQVRGKLNLVVTARTA